MPERRQKELSAPRPRAGRLVIFIFALCEQRRSLQSGGSHCFGWTWHGRSQFCELVALFGELRKGMIFTENHDSP